MPELIQLGGHGMSGERPWRIEERGFGSGPFGDGDWEEWPTAYANVERAERDIAECLSGAPPECSRADFRVVNADTSADPYTDPSQTPPSSAPIP